MAWTLDDALSDDLVTVVSRDDSVGFYELKIGNLDTVVSIKLSRNLDSERTEFEVSHSVKTPQQIGPYHTSQTFADYPGYALHKAVSGLTSYYRDAVRSGHKPNESWLVED